MAKLVEIDATKVALWATRLDRGLPAAAAAYEKVPSQISMDVVQSAGMHSLEPFEISLQHLEYRPYNGDERLPPDNRDRLIDLDGSLRNDGLD